jgi:hypothetical protein
MSHVTMDIDAMLMQTDERARRVARQKLLDNANDPVVKDFFDAEARLQMHKERVMRQMETVNKVMNVAERDVSQLVTTKWVHQTGKFEDKLNASALHLGPALTSVTADARVFECIRMLLGGRPEFVDDVTFIAQMSTFAHPTETIDSACVSLEKLLTDTYATAHELAACVNPQHAAKLASMVTNARPIFASMAQMIQTVHKGCIGTRQDIEQLQGTIEVLKQHQQKAVRIGRELMRENETLRRQLFKSTVGSGGTAAAADEDPNSAAGILNDTAGARQKQQSTKIVVLVQVEGCLQLKFKSPFMVSEALLVVQSIIESLTIKHKGSRVNYNPLYETRELFDRATNRRFAPESFALSFNSAGAAVLFASELHEQLLAGKWPQEMAAEEHFRARFPTVTVDDAGQETVLWAGLSVRAAVHTGIPFVSYPLAEAASASAGAADGGSAGPSMAQLSMIPFFGGLAMEKAMLLMQKTRAGETLVTADAMKLFDAERFSDTTLSRTISTVAREVEGIQVGFDADERIFSAVPRSIELRVTPEPSPYAYRALGNSVFPSSAFWRQIDQIEEFQASDFEEEKSNFAAAAMLPHEYEARIEELEAAARKLNTKIAYLEENGQRLVTDALQYNDDRKAAVQRAERAEAKHARYKALMERRVPTMMRNIEGRALAEHDAALQASLRLEEAEAEIEGLKESLAEALARIPEPVDTEEGECNTEEPYPNVKEIIEKVKHNIQANAAERRAAMNCEACSSYNSQLDDMAAFLGKCSETFKDALTGNAAAAEVIRIFNKDVAQLLFAADVRAGSMGDLTTQEVEEQATELADVNLAIYDKLCDGATKPDAFVHRPELRGAIVHAAGITRTVCRFALGKSIGNRMKNSSENYADELEFLMAQNEKLERRIVELHGARKEDLDKHRTAIAKLQGESASDIKSAESRHEDLDLRVKLLSMKLKETSERAQAFFLETCELMDQLEATKSTADKESHSNSRIKASFDQLKATYALGSEATEAERVLRESNQKLARAVHALETRVKAREAELKLQRKTQEELKAMKADELELARAAGATAALEEAEEELDDRVADAERRARRTAAEARAEDAQKHAEDASKAEERRRRDERRREELRAQREALDREEWKKNELERLVEEEVERRLEVARWGNRGGDGSSAAGTPGAGASMDGAMDVRSLPKPRRRRPAAQTVASGTDGGTDAADGHEFTDDDAAYETCERSTQVTPHGSAESPISPTQSSQLPPSLTALVSDSTPQVELPPSMLLPGEPRASSARTFLCTGCSKKYMLRSASTSVRGDTAGMSVGGEGHAWAENAEAQTSRGHSPVDTSSAPPPTAPETQTPAVEATVVREVNERTGTSATCSTQTAVSLRPGAAVYPVAEVATLTETIIGYTEDGTPVSVSVEQLLSEKDQNRRPVMLRAVAVGEGFLVLTADAASHMEEAWLMDVATQCDPSPVEDNPEPAAAAATPTAAALSRSGVGSSTSLLRKGRASGASTPTGAAARRTASNLSRVSSGSRRAEQPPVASPPAVPLHLPAAAIAQPLGDPVATRSIATTTSGLVASPATAASQTAVRLSSVPVQANMKRSVAIAESQTQVRPTKDFGASATPEALGRRVAAIAVQCELLTDRMAADAQASLGDLMGKQRGRLQNTSPTGFMSMSNNRKLAPVKPVRVQEDDQEALLRKLRESAPVVSDPTAYSALAQDGREPVAPFKRKPLSPSTSREHDAAPITTGPGRSNSPADNDIYRPHPKHAIERRGHELAVPLAQSGMPAIPAAIAARLMERARRDVTGAHPPGGQHRDGSGGYSGVVGASGGSPRGPGSPKSNREMEFTEPGVAPWTVAPRPDLERRSPSRRDADEDEDDLLAKFGLAHRDEVSLRAVHTKRPANGPAAKYDVKKKAPVNLIIGKPTRAATPDAAMAGQQSRATAAGQRSTAILDAGRPRRAPLPLTPQPAGSRSTPGSRAGSASAKQQLQQLSESGQ